MVLVPVRDNQSAQAVAILDEIREVGNDDVDSQHIVLGKHEAGIDEYNRVGILDDHHVQADFAQPSQWYQF